MSPRKIEPRPVGVFYLAQTPRDIAANMAEGGEIRLYDCQGNWLSEPMRKRIAAYLKRQRVFVRGTP